MRRSTVSIAHVVVLVLALGVVARAQEDPEEKKGQEKAKEKSREISHGKIHWDARKDGHDAAVKKAKEENRLVLVHFFATW